MDTSAGANFPAGDWGYPGGRRGTQIRSWPRLLLRFLAAAKKMESVVRAKRVKRTSSHEGNAEKA